MPGGLRRQMTESNRVSSMVTQQASGFSRGLCVRFDGTNWVRATTGQAGVGLVGDTGGANSFEFVQMGHLEGLDGLVPGTPYYPDSLGNLSTVANGTAVAVAYTDTSLFVLTPSAISAASSSTGVDLSSYVTSSQLVAAIASLQSQIDRLTRGVSKTLAYTGELLTSVTDVYGGKTLSYDVNNRLAGITGTGIYASKTFGYTGEQLTTITVS